MSWYSDGEKFDEYDDEVFKCKRFGKMCEHANILGMCLLPASKAFFDALEHNGMEAVTCWERRKEEEND